MIRISDHKAEEMAEHAKKILKHGGKLMQCIEELCEENGFGERDGYPMGERVYMNRGGYAPMGQRGGYGHMGMREQEMPQGGYDHMGERYEGMGERWEDPYFMGERRGRSAYTGRYIHRP